MKQKGMGWLIVIGVIAAVVAYGVSSKIVKATNKNLSIPVVGTVDGSLPDVRNDSSYNVIFNENALDPTQPVQIQGNNNSTPFTSQ